MFLGDWGLDNQDLEFDAGEHSVTKISESDIEIRFSTSFRPMLEKIVNKLAILLAYRV